MANNEFTIPIPARLKNVAKGGHVAGADQIIDDALGKEQSVINQEVSEAIEDNTEAIAAERQRAEAAEGALDNRLSDVEELAEISIDGGEAKIATGEDFTNPDATKRAKVPTVGAIVDGLNDGVYDVSKRNPTAGPNSDGKFTLDYILSNANTLIPTGWRHGGMSIKFIQSSDNKYVQYRYTGAAVIGTPNPFLDTYNWENVDVVYIDTSLNDLNAETDEASKTITSVIGHNFLLEIPINIPKGEIFSVCAKFDGIYNTPSTIAFKLNDINSSPVKYLNDSVWEIIRPTVVVNKILIAVDRGQVANAVPVTLSVKKLQSITKDGKILLYDGGLGTDGAIWQNGNRKNTRVILNDRPLYLSINAPYQVNYVYGNDPTNLTDGSYISALSGGGQTVLDVNAKYIGFTIVKGSTDTFDDVRFIVANANSNAAKANKNAEDASVAYMTPLLSGNPLFPFIQGTRDTSGIVSTNTKRLTSQIIRFNGTICIDFDGLGGQEIMPVYKAVGSNTWTELGWKSGVLFTYDGNGELFINVSEHNNAAITPEYAKNISCYMNNGAAEITEYPLYKYSLIGSGSLYYDSTDIYLKKGRRYKITFSSSKLEAVSQTGEILSIFAQHLVDSGTQSIAYRTNGNVTIPDAINVTPTEDSVVVAYCKITKDSYLNITIQEFPTSINKAVSQRVPQIDRTERLLNFLKTRQFLEGDLLTSDATKLVFNMGYDIVEGGECYAGVLYANNSSGEQVSPHYNTGLIVCNILNPSETKHLYTAHEYGEQVLGIACNYISGESVAKKISGSEVALFNPGYYLNGNKTCATRVFNLNTKTFGEWQNCYMNVGSNRYLMDTNENSIRAIYAATGMYNWANVPAIIGSDWGYYICGNPIKIGEWFWCVLNIGSYAPALVKTQDFVDFYYVCEMPFGITVNGTWIGNPTEEVAIEYFNNRIYATCRGNKGRFTGLTPEVDYSGWSQIISCNFDEILAYDFETSQNKPAWTTPLSLEPCCFERCTIVAFNNKLFVWQGYGTPSYKGVEGKNMDRYRHHLIIFDRDLNILSREMINPNDGCLHPTFFKYGNSVYSINHTDVRNYTFFGDGNNRSEIRLNRLDMRLLEI